MKSKNTLTFKDAARHVLGTGRWLSRSATVRNPFFGSAMPECGEELN